MTLNPNEKDTLLGHRDMNNREVGEESDDDREFVPLKDRAWSLLAGEPSGDDRDFVPLKDRGWSFSQSRRKVATAATSPIPSRSIHVPVRQVEDSTIIKSKPDGSSRGGNHYIFCLIYAVVNVIIAVPGLFGYAAVIFNHPVFSNHMNALSKRK